MISLEVATKFRKSIRAKDPLSRKFSYLTSLSEASIFSSVKTVSLVKDAQGFIDAWKKFNKESSSAETPSAPKGAPVTFSFSNKDWPTPSSPFREQFITFIEVFWFTEKRLPTKAECFDKFGNFEWEDTIVSVADSLQNRGIIPYETPVGYLQPNFVLAVNLMLAVHDRRSIAAKLKEAGLTTKQWKSFLRIPHYSEYFNKQLDDLYDEETRSIAKLKLSEAVASGDLQAIKYFNELQNVYRPHEDTNSLVKEMLQVIVDIVAIHVEPAVLAKIANALSERNVLDVSSKELKV